jgi:archaellin
MSNGIKFLVLAAAIVLACSYIGFGFYTGREAKAVGTTAVGQISNMNREFSEADKVMYDGLDVSGSEVVNAINKFKNDDTSIKVSTKKSVIYYNRLLTNSDTELGGVSTASVKDTQLITSSTYINQKAQFTGTVLRDVNDTIICISFKQK